MNLPEARYAKAPDGVSLAYHVVGDGPIDLIWLHAFMGGLEVIWEHEAMRSLTTKLSSFARVIRHDMRATGLSGRATELPNLETQVQDVAAVLDAVGSRSTVILGGSQMVGDRDFLRWYAKVQRHFVPPRVRRREQRRGVRS